MRILFLWPDRLRRDLGGPKIVVEIAEALQQIGWETTLYDPWTLPDGSDTQRLWASRCHNYLKEHAREFDVVDYDHGHLPYPRTDFNSTTLMVARSGLLSHHFVKIKIPDLYPWRDGLRRLLKGRGAHERHEENLRAAQTTCEAADLVNVSNFDDQAELIRCGFRPDKVHVFPFGINEERRELFREVSPDLPDQPRIAFVGAFDARKGATHFADLVAQVSGEIPNVLFRLLGTRGRMGSKEEVENYFPPSLRRFLEVIPEYVPNELPKLLSGCALGVFPSYVEGFPFGVLEMLAAALPVVAFRAPGAPMMVGADFLVETGDTRSMAKKIVYLLQNPSILSAARDSAKQRSEDFSWKKTAALTAEVYREAINRIRSSQCL